MAAMLSASRSLTAITSSLLCQKKKKKVRSHLTGMRFDGKRLIYNMWRAHLSRNVKALDFSALLCRTV